MRVKIHRTPDKRTVVAVCDNEIFGKCFEQGELCLDLSSEFFNGDEMTAKEATKILLDAYVVNFAGQRSVELGKNLNLVDADKIKKIDDVPYAQVVVVDDSR